MARVILLTDFGEEYSNNLMKGIVQYSRETSPWVLCKMPLSYRDVHGIEGVLRWAKEWKADAIIGQFYNTDNVSLFKEENVIAVAQDFKDRFTNIPNITGNHIRAGEIGAEHFIQKGFKNYAFLGIKNAIWSSERCEGFKKALNKVGLLHSFYEYQKDVREELWYYEEDLEKWLIELPKPVAIMACDDNQAHHISEICKLHDIKIPSEVSLLGVDNDQMICLLSDPPISSINQNTIKGGYQVANLIDKLTNNPQYRWANIVVEPTYITTRASSNIFSTNNPHISIVLQYIHENIKSKLSVQSLVNLVPLSRRSLEQLFREVTGDSIYSYILKLRIERFASELIETDNPIVDIALELGYIDYKNISRQFKSLKGCTPSEYREQNRIDVYAI
ncbi:DNA-binding transcriptional regulator [Dysgonomonas sp. Marseille-P4361]|uniref:DNA-binding transcriptional regulator n=1 Tax=Dysgonomonas sp. Marseille-P4361 TaxID=2161820 RepID=UPI000D55BDD3|nr:DNA-binding transcriptional regulator [Dysgonomonas sp. Marseille-P4361]